MSARSLIPLGLLLLTAGCGVDDGDSATGNDDVVDPPGFSIVASPIPVYVLAGSGPSPVADFFDDPRLADNEIFILPKDPLDDATDYTLDLVVETTNAVGTERFAFTTTFTTGTGNGGTGATGVLNEINALRTEAGLAALSWDADYADAGIRHAGYQDVAGRITHIETDTGNPWYVGEGLGQRIDAAKGGSYPDAPFFWGPGIDWVSEIISSMGSHGPGVAHLWNTVYHRQPLLRAESQIVGGGHSGDSPVDDASPAYLTLELGAYTGTAITLTVWPSDGSTSLAPSFATDTESPDPISSGNGNGTPDDNQVGGPLHVTVPTSAQITGLTVSLDTAHR